MNKKADLSMETLVKIGIAVVIGIAVILFIVLAAPGIGDSIKGGLNFMRF